MLVVSQVCVRLHVCCCCPCRDLARLPVRLSAHALIPLPRRRARHYGLRRPARLRAHPHQEVLPTPSGGGARRIQVERHPRAPGPAVGSCDLADGGRGRSQGTLLRAWFPAQVDPGARRRVLPRLWPGLPDAPRQCRQGPSHRCQWRVCDGRQDLSRWPHRNCRTVRLVRSRAPCGLSSGCCAGPVLLVLRTHRPLPPPTVFSPGTSRESEPPQTSW